ncbi:AAA family ATPase [Streptomyces sp. NPDC003635]
MTSRAPRPPRGREAETRVLVDALSGAVSGGGGAVLLRGPAGIGKSCLARHVLDTLASPWHVVRLRATPLDSHCPTAYGTLATVRLTGPEAVRTPAAELVACLAAAAEGGDHRGVTVTSARLLRHLRDGAPTVLAVDDLTHADPHTLTLLARLARSPARHPLVVLAAQRSPRASGRPLSAFLDTFETPATLRVVELTPLDVEAVADLAADVLRAPPSPALAARLHGRTGGNPFLVVESASRLAQSGGPQQVPGPWPSDPAEPALDEDGCERVVRRLVGTASGTLRVARAAAVLRTVPTDGTDLLARIAQLPHDRAEAGFDALVVEGVLHTGAPGEHAFAQPLVRDALYRQLGPAARRRAHALAADWMLDHPHAQADLPVHVAASADHGDTRAVAILAAAAGRALPHAPADAAAWYHRALHLAPSDHPLRADLVTRLTLAQLVDGQVIEAVRTGSSASGAACGGAGRGARLSAVVAGALIEHAAMGEAAAFVDAARAADDSVVLTAQAAHVQLMTGQVRRAVSTADVAEARLASAAVTDRIAALGFLAPVRYLSSPHPVLATLVRRLRDAASQAPAAARLDALSTLGLLLSLQGDTEACAEALSEAEPLLTTCGWNIFRGRLAAARVHRAALTGAWDEAFADIAAVTRSMEHSGSQVHLGLLRMVEATLHAHRGNWDAARRAADSIDRVHPPLTSAAIGAHSEIDLVQGDLDSGRRRLTRWLAQPSLPARLRGRLLVKLASIEAETASPAAVAALLAEARENGVDDHDHLGFVEARLAQGRAAGDPAALHEALAVADRHHLTLLRGRIHLALGAAGADAERHLRTALDTFHGLGALPWCRRAGAELRRRDLKVPRHRASPSAPLTTTEIQVARYVQLGRSNREIAQALSLSVKTVERHLSRVYAKTGCPGRVHLVRALDRGLLGETGPDLA